MDLGSLAKKPLKTQGQLPIELRYFEASGKPAKRRHLNGVEGGKSHLRITNDFIQIQNCQTRPAHAIGLPLKYSIHSWLGDAYLCGDNRLTPSRFNFDFS